MSPIALKSQMLFFFLFRRDFGIWILQKVSYSKSFMDKHMELDNMMTFQI